MGPLLLEWEQVTSELLVPGLREHSCVNDIGM